MPAATRKWSHVWQFGLCATLSWMCKLIELMYTDLVDIFRQVNTWIIRYFCLNLHSICYWTLAEALTKEKVNCGKVNWKADIKVKIRPAVSLFTTLMTSVRRLGQGICHVLWIPLTQPCCLLMTGDTSKHPIWGGVSWHKSTLGGIHCPVMSRDIRLWGGFMNFLL